MDPVPRYFLGEVVFPSIVVDILAAIFFAGDQYVSENDNLEELLIEGSRILPSCYK